MKTQRVLITLGGLLAGAAIGFVIGLGALAVFHWDPGWTIGFPALFGGFGLPLVLNMALP